MTYPGIYRAICSANNDPESLMRIKVTVPQLLGTTETGWAWPALPNMIRTDPPGVGDPVWVMFEAGGIEKPVWMGVWQPVGELNSGGPPDFFADHLRQGEVLSVGSLSAVVETPEGNVTAEFRVQDEPPVVGSLVWVVWIGIDRWLVLGGYGLGALLASPSINVLTAEQSSMETLVRQPVGVNGDVVFTEDFEGGSEVPLTGDPWPDQWRIRKDDPSIITELYVADIVDVKGYALVQVDGYKGVTFEPRSMAPVDNAELLVTVDPPEYSGGADERQRVQLTGDPTGGFFKLTFAGFTTIDIAHNSTNTLIQNALAALPSIGTGNVAVSAGPLPSVPIDIDFVEAKGWANQPQMTSSHTLTGGTTPGVLISTLLQGFPDNQPFEFHAIHYLRASGWGTDGISPTDAYTISLYHTGPDRQLWLGKRVNGVSSQRIKEIVAPDGIVNIKAQVIGSVLKAKIWLVGTTEPTSWALELVDGTVTKPGTVGLGWYGGGGTSFPNQYYEVWWDDVVATWLPGNTPIPLHTSHDLGWFFHGSGEPRRQAENEVWEELLGREFKYQLDFPAPGTSWSEWLTGVAFSLDTWQAAKPQRALTGKAPFVPVMSMWMFPNFVAQAWQFSEANGDNWAIRSGRAQRIIDNGQQQAWIDCHKAEGVLLEATLHNPGVGVGSLIFRLVDGDNHYLAQIVNGTVDQWYKRVAGGAYIPLAGLGATTFITGDRFGVRCVNANTFEFLKNGVVFATQSDPAFTFPHQTKFGIGGTTALTNSIAFEKVEWKNLGDGVGGTPETHTDDFNRVDGPLGSIQTSWTEADSAYWLQQGAAEAWQESTPGAIKIVGNRAIGPAPSAWRSAQVRAHKADCTVSAKVYGFSTTRFDLPGPGCRMSAGLNGYWARFVRSGDYATTRLYLTQWLNGAPSTLVASGVLAANPVDGATISITCEGSTISATGGGVTIQATSTTFATQDGAGFFTAYANTPLDDFAVTGRGVGGVQGVLSDTFNRADGSLGNFAGYLGYDTYWDQAAAMAVSRGLQSDVIWRPAWEMNGDFFRWWAGANLPAFRAYWRRIVGRFSAGGCDGGIFWCPLNGGGSYIANPDIPGGDVIQIPGVDYYPGDEWVDYIGSDPYDYWYAQPNRTPQDRWAEVRRGMDWTNAFAIDHNKPVAFGEWGLWSPANDPAVQEGGGGGDNPYFIEQMSKWINEHQVEFACYFNVDGWNYTHMLEQLPLSKAQFIESFAGPIVPSVSANARMGGWSGVANCVVSQGATGSHGVRSAKVVASLSGDVEASTPTAMNGVPVVRSVYTALLDVQAATVGRLTRVKVWWYNHKGHPLGTVVSPAVLSTTTGWTTIVLTVTVPPGGARAAVGVVIEDAGAGEVHYVDKVGLLGGGGSVWELGSQVVSSGEYPVIATGLEKLTVSSYAPANPGIGDIWIRVM